MGVLDPWSVTRVCAPTGTRYIPELVNVRVWLCRCQVGRAESRTVRNKPMLLKWLPFLSIRL